MILTSYQTAFHREEDGDVKVREIKIPDAVADGLAVERLLEQAYHYGQNETQNVPGCCSLSIGDVIRVGDDLYRVGRGFGFVKLPKGESPTKLKGRDARWFQEV